MSDAEFWDMVPRTCYRRIRGYHRNIERQAIVLRELYAITYNINRDRDTDSQGKRGRDLIPFSIDPASAAEDAIPENELELVLKMMQNG